jgi:hypothetical protein
MVIFRLLSLLYNQTNAKEISSYKDIWFNTS